MRYARGRRPAVHNAKTMRSALALAPVLDALGPPPAVCNDYMAAVAHLPCGMDGNDTYGCCVPCDTAHSLTIRTANAQTATVVPTRENVLALYSTMTTPPFQATDPATDTGVDEVSMCTYLRDTGWMGDRADDFTTVAPNNLDHLMWMVYLCGPVRIGLNLPGYAEDQFEAGKPWDVSSQGDQTQGGHDVPVVDYRGGLFYVCTWGRWMQPVTPAFLLAFCEEVHPELHYDWIRAQGTAPSGLDLADLDSRLRVAQADGPGAWA